MNFEDFVAQVQYRAHLGSPDEALRAIRATLATLGERVDRTDVRMLASQLPGDIAEFLLMGNRRGRREFSSDEFFIRVAGREQLDIPAAVFHVQVVFEVMCEVAPRCEIAEVLERFSREFCRIILSRSRGRLKSRRETIRVRETILARRQRSRQLEPFRNGGRRGSLLLSKRVRQPLAPATRSQRRYASRTE